jgi:hypothetical protein
MKFVPFARIARTHWDEACDASLGAWLYHRAEWVAIEAERFVRENLSFGVIEQDRIIGLQPLYLSEVGLGTFNERLLHSGIHRHTGLALVNGIDRGTATAAQRVAMQRIGELAHTLDVDRIQLNAQNLAPVNRGPEREEIPWWVRSDGFQLGVNFGPSGILPVPGMTTCCADQVVELAPPLPELFTALDEPCRRAVRKAEAAGLDLEVGNGGSCVTRYYELAQLSVRRTGEVLPPIEYFAQVWDALGAVGRCAILFARHEARDVAALLLAIDRGAASFLAGVSDPAELSLRSNDFVHWQAIRWLKARGIACYRLGPAFPELPEAWPIVRVSRFKTKFGTRSVPLIQGSLYRHPEKYVAHGIAHLQTLAVATSAA